MILELGNDSRGSEEKGSLVQVALGTTAWTRDTVVTWGRWKSAVWHVHQRARAHGKRRGCGTGRDRQQRAVRALLCIFLG